MIMKKGNMGLSVNSLKYWQPHFVSMLNMMVRKKVNMRYSVNRRMKRSQICAMFCTVCLNISFDQQIKLMYLDKIIALKIVFNVPHFFCILNEIKISSSKLKVESLLDVECNSSDLCFLTKAHGGPLPPCLRTDK